ncbi:MAG: hypothetical protein RMM17_03240 [Acidobacteriota bacterium]|nr:hypothetical protein [Blastocatellia bacterium]MDW8411684.1 hypothetical protein [Acidobacteriota bacterium]
MKKDGFGLVIVVLFLWVVVTVLILEVLIYTGTRLADANLESALRWSDGFGLSVATAVRTHIEEHIYSAIERDVRDHIDKQLRGDAYFCQTAVTSETPLSEQSSLCNPAGILDGLRGKTGQTIDDVTALKPDDPNLLLTPEWREILRETRNSYDYALKGVFVSKELVQEAVRLEQRKRGRPRVERYRWMIRADIDARTYYDVNKRFVVYYDVVTNLYTFDSITTGVVSCPRTGSLLKKMPMPFVVKCETLEGTPGDTNCREPELCMPGSECFQRECSSRECQRNLATCLDSNYQDQFCLTLAPGLGFLLVANSIPEDTHNTSGCFSVAIRGNRDSRRLGGYTWNTVIKVVDIGSNFD